MFQFLCVRARKVSCVVFYPVSNRLQKSFIKLNETSFWVVGGSPVQSLSVMASTVTWTVRAGPTLPKPITLVCSTMVNTTHIFVGGGKAPQITGESWMYDRVRESWTQLPDMLQPRQGAGCGVSGKHVVVFGGYEGTDWINSTEIFNLDSWSWFQGQPTPYKFTSHNILQHGNGRDTLLAFGGTIVNDTHTEDTDAILRYDSEVMGWVHHEKSMEEQASRVLPVAASPEMAAC